MRLSALLPRAPPHAVATCLIAIGLAMAGTTLAGKTLHTMTDDQFRRWTWLFIHAISVAFIARGIRLLIVSPLPMN